MFLVRYQYVLLYFVYLERMKLLWRLKVKEKLFFRLFCYAFKLNIVWRLKEVEKKLFFRLFCYTLGLNIVWVTCYHLSETKTLFNYYIQRHVLLKIYIDNLSKDMYNSNNDLYLEQKRSQENSLSFRVISLKCKRGCLSNTILDFQAWQRWYTCVLNVWQCVTLCMRDTQMLVGT